MSRILVWAGEHGACQFNRLVWPARALAAQGADVVIDPAGPTIMWDRRWTGTPGDAQVMEVLKPDADVVVLQRPVRRYWADVIPKLQTLGVRVVVDVDDDFTCVHPDNVAWHAHNARNPHVNASWVMRACALADAVVTTTPALAARYGHGHAVVVPNMVPAAYLDIEAETLPDTAGWSGSVLTHPVDLQAASGAIGRILHTQGWGFHVVGTADGVAERLGLDAEPSATGWIPIEDYPAELARLAVGVVPLADSAFNRAKSALKMAEMAALGVPVVASPTPDNRRLHDAGVGLLAAAPQRWHKHLRRLTGSPQLRADLAGRGRDVMASQTIEGNCWRWYDAWAHSFARKAAA